MPRPRVLQRTVRNERVVLQQANQPDRSWEEQKEGAKGVQCCRRAEEGQRGNATMQRTKGMEWKGVLQPPQDCQISRSCNSWRECNDTSHSNRREVLGKKEVLAGEPGGKDQNRPGSQDQPREVLEEPTRGQHRSTTYCNHSNTTTCNPRQPQQHSQANERIHVRSRTAPTMTTKEATKRKCNELVQQPPQQNEENHAIKGTPGSCQKELLQPPQPTRRSTRNQPSRGIEEKGKEVSRGIN
jgi:hypothetical protein